MRLQQLTAEHRDAVLAFETGNRGYFAATVPDRGDAFFADYPARHAALLALQAAGTDFFHVLLTDGGAVAGRVNLVDVRAGEAELGFRVGRDFTGRGVATEAVIRVCDLAFSTYGLRRLRAGAAMDNHGSRAVLLRAGFILVGEGVTDGRPDGRYALDLPGPGQVDSTTAMIGGPA